MIEERVKSNHKAKKSGKREPEIEDKGVRGTQSAAERSIAHQFLGALIEVDQALRKKAERTPAPTWAGNPQYLLRDEVEYRAQVVKLEEQIAEIQQKKTDTERKLDAAGSLRGLLFETGKPLESAILEALRLLGFDAEPFADQESEFDALFTDQSGIRLLGEAEGKNDKPVNIDKLDQLERNIQEDFKKRPDSTVYAKGVLFGNAFRLLPPAERSEYFTDKCIAGAKRVGVALVRTPDLFRVSRFLKENGDDDFARSCRKAILETNGDIVKFPAVPNSTKASG